MSRSRLRGLIATHRDRITMRAAAIMAEKYLRAYHNQCNWDIRQNGESFLFSELAAGQSGHVLDVGANIGQWATMALNTGLKGKFHCFEISPLTFTELENNFGLFSSTGRMEIFHYKNSSDRTSAIYIDDGFDKQLIQAHVTTGDKYIAQNSLDKISFLKIDVEGMEMSVLEGFSHVLKENMINAVQFEHGPAHIKTRHFLGDFIDFFNQYDYNCFKVFPNALREIDIKNPTAESFSGANFIAIHESVRLNADLVRK